MISTYCLSNQFVVRCYLNDNTSWVTNIDAKELLPQSHHADTSWTWESYVHTTIKQLIVTIKECIIKSDTNFISIKRFILLLANQTLIIFLEHEAQFCFNKLRESLFHIARYFSTILTMAISNWKEMAVFKSTEVRNGYPSILICLVRIRWRLPRLGSKCKFCNTICVHLLWIGRVKRIVLCLNWWRLLITLW